MLKTGYGGSGDGSSPLKLFTNAKKKINSIYGDIGKYVGDFEKFAEKVKTTEEKELIEKVCTYVINWIKFATSGNNNRPGTYTWSKKYESTACIMIIRDEGWRDSVHNKDSSEHYMVITKDSRCAHTIYRPVYFKHNFKRFSQSHLYNICGHVIRKF